MRNYATMKAGIFLAEDLFLLATLAPESKKYDDIEFLVRPSCSVKDSTSGLPQ